MAHWVRDISMTHWVRDIPMMCWVVCGPLFFQFPSPLSICNIHNLFVLDVFGSLFGSVFLPLSSWYFDDALSSRYFDDALICVGLSFSNSPRPSVYVIYITDMLDGIFPWYFTCTHKDTIQHVCYVYYIYWGARGIEKREAHTCHATKIPCNMSVMGWLRLVGSLKL